VCGSVFRSQQEFFRYFEFEINPVGAVYDGRNVHYYFCTDTWNPEWTHAARTTDRYWEAEMAIPFVSLETSAPMPGEIWFANVARCIGPITVGGRRYRQFQSWADIPSLNFHRVEWYGVWIFQ